MKATKHNADSQQPAKQGDHEEAPGESCLYVNWIWNTPWHSWDWHCHRAISSVWFCDCGNGKCILAIGYGILWKGTEICNNFWHFMRHLKRTGWQWPSGKKPHSWKLLGKFNLVMQRSLKSILLVFSIFVSAEIMHLYKFYNQISK